MASSRPPPPMPLDLNLTIISAKHLKNVNWKSGDLKPYAVFWVDPDRRLSTKSDDSGSTRPVWNERFTLPLTVNLRDSFLTLEIFHSKPSETPKPLVGTLRVALKDLPDPDDANRIRTFELTRPSGRPQGKIRIKLGVRERLFSPPPPPQPVYRITTPQSYYYSGATMPPPDYRYPTIPLPPSSSPPPPPVPHYGSYHDAYPPSPYYPGYYSSAPPTPLPPRPFFDRPMGSYGSGPSAPVDYGSYDTQRLRGGKTLGVGTGLAVGAVAGALGGLALEEGLKYEEEKIAEKVENDLAARDDYSDYRADY
ncbi:unnamed protein product [Dovyalis caffra]|uniref:C2 domain-containing protein n=1 Tax=Dovyalis caffra TaxID=77055 RepID=A0AAV1QVJ5_9ROSI|nr:unnamed protein product [Dovyalis caffra]